jgi:hypothetical protein
MDVSYVKLSDTNVQRHIVAMFVIVDSKARISQSIKTFAGDQLRHSAGKPLRRLSMPSLLG